jgi:hypothetical protein
LFSIISSILEGYNVSLSKGLLSCENDMVALTYDIADLWDTWEKYDKAGEWECDALLTQEDEASVSRRNHVHDIPVDNHSAYDRSHTVTFSYEVEESDSYFESASGDNGWNASIKYTGEDIQS